MEIELANTPNSTGAPGRMSCVVRGAGQHLGQHLRQRARRGHRAHGPGKDERRDDAVAWLSRA